MKDGNGSSLYENSKLRNYGTIFFSANAEIEGWMISHSTYDPALMFGTLCSPTLL